jgi:allantoin racemase
MRLWYQRMSRQATWGAYSRALYEIIDCAKDPSTEVEVHGLVRTSGFSDQFRYGESLEVGELLDNVRLAAESGFDAFLIDSIADPGLQDARELVDFPVLGLCESSLTVAGMIGSRLSLVTIDEKSIPRIRENVERYGFKDRVAHIQLMQLEAVRDLDRAFDDVVIRRQIIERFQAAAHANPVVEPEVIIAAGGIIMALLAYAEVDETDDGTPILEGVANLVQMGEMAVKVNRILEGKFTADRLEVAAELVRSYESASRRRHLRVRPGATLVATSPNRRSSQGGSRFG